jgi:signal transduction histidine kinase
LHGYHYEETMREWGHLQTVLCDEVEAFGLSHPQFDPRSMSVARRILNQLFVACMVESAAGHVRHQEAEAASRLRDLQQMLAELKGLERDRADLWREAAHDLRSNVGAVQLATRVLAHPAGADADPRDLHRVERTVHSLRALLDDMIDLARLEAGRENWRTGPFDAGALVRDLVDGLEVVASEKRLRLHLEAPASLCVQGDAPKVRRIAQNLLWNALRYTEKGQVVVTVRAFDVGDVPSWELRVQDTGVGISDRRGPAIARLLHRTSQEAEALAAQSGQAPLPPLNAMASKTSPDAVSAPGEGVGLTIVKRLCELLDATIDIETALRRGTTVRVVFPRRYSSSPVDSAL